MKRFIISICCLFSISAKAHNVLLRASFASEISYEQFLRKNPQWISYIEHLQTRMQKQTQQEEKLFSLADTFSTNKELTLLHLKGLQTESPWTLLSLRFVRDLTERSFSSSPLELRKDLQSLYCKAAVLLNDAPLAISCPTQYVSLEALHRKFPKIEKVLIESLGFSLTDSINPAIAAQASYHWTFISNSTEPVSFYGTYAQLFQQSFLFKDLIQGSCDGFSTDMDSIELQSISTVYFSEACLKRTSMPAEKKAHWYEDRKTWIGIASVAILGGIIYSMKDKKVVVNSNSLNF